jgi:hypothetical protein
LLCRFTKHFLPLVNDNQMKWIQFVGICLLLAGNTVTAQPETGLQQFWKQLEKHCGKSYEGIITAGGKEGDGFTGQKLVMQVLDCKTGVIKIPFYVGENKSRTWILTKQDDRLSLKHDHRHKDGSPDSITYYGGTASNSGAAGMQVFPADQETCSLLPYACGNVWWVTINEQTFTYNLRRIGSDRLFTVSFNLEKPVIFNDRPWGWADK